MTSREINPWVGEYTNVLARAAREGWLRPLLGAHLTSCTRATAEMLLRELALPVPVTYRWRDGRHRGHARFNGLRYLIVLPTLPNPRSCHLRIGLVLHEAAHVLDHRGARKFSHGPTFCHQLRELLARHWTDSWREECVAHMTKHNFREIYARHRGPYWIMLTRVVEKRGGKVEHVTDKIDGPLSAEDAHEEARVIVNAKKDPSVVDAYVFSSSEGQFIGARYTRGEEYVGWSQMRDEALAEQLRDVDDAPAALAAAGDDAQPGLPEVARPKARAPRVQGARPALELDPGHAEAWPRSAGAGLVRASLEQDGPATASDLAQRIAAECAKVGVAFPASLISRLKQGGFLREVGA